VGRALLARDLGFTYAGAASPALRGLHLQVDAGELVMLAGPSGGGKTTAARGLAGLLGGSIPGEVRGVLEQDGSSIMGGGGRSVPSEVALVQQDPDSHLCTLTVQDEVAFGPENLCLDVEEVRRRIDEALGAVGARGLLDRPTNELSGGEKQRVAIASMLAMRPRALVLDEPTANLDWGARRALLGTLLGFVRSGAGPMVVAEHRLDVLSSEATEIIVLAGGRPKWRGTSEQMRGEAEGLSMMGVRVPGAPELLGLHREEVQVGDAVLRVRGLVASYGERRVLEGVDLEVRAGELLALVGPNGGGKTTLLRCVMGLMEPQDGKVELAGVDVKSAPASQRARVAGLVFQSPDHQLFARTVREELEYGPRNLGQLSGQVYQRIEALARDYGLESVMGTHPFRLSHGQKRRLNIASVQACGGRLLMLDEPFIGQDILSVRAINARLQEAKAQGAAVVVVSHDLEALGAMADRAVELVGGRARELDDVADLERAALAWGAGG
jgi:energy-coupling factor transporter ATP-binding protein EcfA2